MTVVVARVRDLKCRCSDVGAIMAEKCGGLGMKAQ